MGNLGMGELFVLLLLALVVFGPQKLPEIARNVGRAFRAFQQETQKAANVLRQAVEEDPAATKAGVVDTPDGAAPDPAAPAPARDAPVAEPEVAPEPRREWEDT